MKEQLMKIITSHNALVTTLSHCDIPVPDGKMFRAMEIWHKLSCEGADITHMAREAGIDAKCNMQTGEIIVTDGEFEPRPELNEYDPESHRRDIQSDGVGLGTYEVVFDVADCRYYCFLHDCASMNEALALFFQNHPRITYSMVVDHEEV